MKTTTIILVVLSLTTICLGDLPADLNCDEIVDFYDFAIFSDQWLEQSFNGSCLPNASIKLKHLSPQLEGLGGIQSPIRIKRLCGFQLDEDWVNNATISSATLANDTADFKVGNQGLKMTTKYSWSAEACLQLDPYNDDFRVEVRSNLGIWVRVEDVNNLGIIRVRLHEDDDDDKFYQWGMDTSEMRFPLVSGKWVLMWIPKHEFQDKGTHQASEWGMAEHPTYNVKKVTLLLQRKTGGPDADVTFGEIMTVDSPKAAVILSFDDACNGVHTYAYPALKSRGWPGVVFINASMVGNPEKLTLSNLHDMYDAGWDICSHGYSHAFHASLTASQTRASLARMKRWLLANGFYRGSQFLAWPFNSAYTNEYNAINVAEEFHLGIRGHGLRAGCNLHLGGYIVEKSSPWIPVDWGQLPWFSVSSLDGKSFSVDYETLFDEAIARRDVLAVFTHDIIESPTNTSITPTFWYNMLAYLDEKVAAGEVEIITYTDWWNRTVGRAGSMRVGYDGDTYLITGSESQRAY